jgi:hypothetical protein
MNLSIFKEDYLFSLSGACLLTSIASKYLGYKNLTYALALGNIALLAYRSFEGLKKSLHSSEPALQIASTLSDQKAVQEKQSVSSEVKPPLLLLTYPSETKQSGNPTPILEPKETAPAV